MNFGIRIRDARIAAGLKQSELGKLLGVANTTISNWEKDVTQPSLEMIELLCGALDVSPNAIIGSGQHNPTPTTLSPEQQEYLKKYYTLNHEGRGRVHAMIDYEFAKQHGAKKVVSEIIFPPAAVTLAEPYLPACAGQGNYLDDNIEYDNVKVLKNKYTYGADLIIKLQGDSMEPEFHDGDRLIVTSVKDESPIYGRVGIFIVNGDAIFRQPLKDVLHPYNDKYPDRVITEYDDFHYVGYVVGIIDDSWEISREYGGRMDARGQIAQ